jgi:dTDP-4-dehydrorhamnose reductase
MTLSTGPLQILLIGRNGQIGWELHRTLATLGPVTAIGRPAIDLAQADTIRSWIESVRPRIIVNAAAYTAVDKAESELQLCMAINGNAPAILAELARRHDALLVHYSTDYVFDGTKQSPYVETDLPNPLGIYGQSKLAADQAIVASGCRHLILRTSWVYGPRGRNFLLTMLRAARQGSPLRVVNDQFGCPTPGRLVAEATAQALARLHERQNLDVRRLYHLATQGATCWHDFARAILTRDADPDRPAPQLEAISTSQYPLPACRPPYSVLSSDQIRADLSIAMPDWETALVQVLEELKPAPAPA